MGYPSAPRRSGKEDGRTRDRAHLDTFLKTIVFTPKHSQGQGITLETQNLRSTKMTMASDESSLVSKQVTQAYSNKGHFSEAEES